MKQKSAKNRDRYAVTVRGIMTVGHQIREMEGQASKCIL